ncbi:MAG: hypothetical protein D6748_00895 [Calditrichaeota bacterium]|nr:MAG: hypothetical protein D6748_00895 [Calditrichota bacterium]
MGKHLIVLTTSDGQEQPTVSPQSVKVKPGDEIEFQCKHTGNQPPAQIQLSFTSGVISEFPDGTIGVEQLMVEPNSSTRAMVSSRATRSSSPVSYTVEVKWGGLTRSVTPQTVMVTTPDLIIDE